MCTSYKPQSGFIHPLISFVIISTFALVGIIGWRVHAFAKHAEAQSSANSVLKQKAPKLGGAVLYGMPLSKAKSTSIDITGEVPEINSKTLPADLDALDTVHRYFEALRKQDYYGSLYYVSDGLWSALESQARTDDVYKMIGLCKLSTKCKSLIATQILNTNFEQTKYRTGSGAEGVSMSFLLAVANPSAAKYYPKDTKITFSLLPYTHQSNAYWAIDRVSVGDMRIN